MERDLIDIEWAEEQRRYFADQEIADYRADCDVHVKHWRYTSYILTGVSVLLTLGLLLTEGR
jgi:hypothetical protein